MATQREIDQQEAFENFKEEFEFLLTRYNLDFEQTYDGGTVTFRDDDEKQEYYL